MSLRGIRGFPDCRAAELRASSLQVDEPRNFLLHRRKSNRVVAGVAGGLADSLGVSDAYVRAAFITLSTIWGLGVLIYVGVWLASFDRVQDIEVEQVETSRAVGLGLAFAGAMILLGVVDLWPSPAVVLTAGTLSFGTAFLSDSSRPGPFSELLDPESGHPSRVRLIVGVVLLIAGLTVFVSTVGAVFEVGVVFLAVALTGLGLVVAFGPWVRRLISRSWRQNAPNAPVRKNAQRSQLTYTTLCCRRWRSFNEATIRLEWPSLPAIRSPSCATGSTAMPRSMG